MPAVLCKNHGVFTWGKDAHEAVHNAVVAEEVAKMAARCEIINPDVKPAPQELQDKHYYRKTWCECLLRTEIRGNRYGKSVFFSTFDDTLYDLYNGRYSGKRSGT